MSLKKPMRHWLPILTTLTVAICIAGPVIRAQTPSTNSYQGSVVQQKATAGVLQLSLDDAIRMGLQNNLGAILAGTNVKTAGGEKLQQLQTLLPTVTGTAQDSVAQVNLQAEGLRLPGFPAVIGPFGYTDFRATLNQALLNVSSLQNYLAARHNFAASKFSAEDSQDLIVLTVGNAYLLCLADSARISSLQAQVETSHISLNQAIQNHQNGVSPRLDELRARVDYQTQQQSLIAAQNEYQKDEIALARAIGLPLDQKFKLTDQVPYAQMDTPTMEQAMEQALKNRNDLKAAEQQTKAAERSLSSAHAERLPSITAEVGLRLYRRKPKQLLWNIERKWQNQRTHIRRGKAARGRSGRQCPTAAGARSAEQSGGPGPGRRERCDSRHSGRGETGQGIAQQCRACE